MYKKVSLVMLVVIVAISIVCHPINYAMPDNATINDDMLQGVISQSELDVIQRFNNDSRFMDIITRTHYYEAEFWRYKMTMFSLEELDEHFDIECVRRVSEELYYTIVLFEDGAKLINLFELQDGHFICIDSWYFNERIHSENFRRIWRFFSTMQDVEKINPSGWFVSTSGTSQTFSQHITVDGYLVNIRYHFPSLFRRDVVSSISMTPRGERTVYSSMLQLDREEILEER